MVRMKTYDEAKFRDLVLYICYKNRDNPHFGSTCLNKNLYYADFFWYAATGESITRDTYIRKEHGPIPKHLIPVRESLERDGLLALETVVYFGREQKKPTVEIEPETPNLSDEERQFVDQIVEMLSPFNATQLSDMTHKELSWQVLQTGEEVPYASIFLRYVNPVPLEAMKWAKETIKEIRLAS